MRLYLLHRRDLPARRTAEALSALFGAPVSNGFVTSSATQTAGVLNTSGVIEEVRSGLQLTGNVKLIWH